MKRNRPKSPESSRPIPVYLYGRERLCGFCCPCFDTVAEANAAKRCTLPCEVSGCTSPHPRPCFCEQCRPTTPRREWRPSW